MENTANVTLNPSNDFTLDAKKEQKKSQIASTVSKVFTYIFLTIVAITSFLPFYWMVMSSLKTEGEFRQSVPTFFPTEGIQWDNYSFVVQYTNANGASFSSYLVNTLIVGILSTGFGVIVTIISAYAFARLEFKGKNLLFTIMLATMMIPGELFTITNYVTTSNFGWKDTYIIMILPFLISFYYIFLLRNAFMQIPDSLFKAAKVDGCSDLGYLVKVMVPLTAPTLISITLLKLIGTWNSYIWPRLVNSESWQLISNWVMQGFPDDKNVLGYNLANQSLNVVRMAASCMVTLPLLILFICFRKYIMSGVSKSGTKG